MRILLLLFLLGACSASGATYDAFIKQPNKGQSQIVIFRPSNLLMMSTRFWIEIDGVEVCKLHNASFVVVDVTVGNHNIASSTFGQIGTSHTTITTYANQMSYVRMDIIGARAIGGALAGLFDNEDGPVYLTHMTKDQALQELPNYNQDCE